MTITEMKIDIIQKVNNLENEELLYEVSRILQKPLNQHSPYRFDDLQMRKLDTSDSEIDNGNYVTHTEAEKDLDKWLK